MTLYYLNEKLKTFPLLIKTSAPCNLGRFTTFTHITIIQFKAVHSVYTCTAILFTRLLYYY